MTQLRVTFDDERCRQEGKLVDAIVERLESCEKKVLFTLSSWYLILEYRLEVMSPIEMPIMFFYHTSMLHSLRELAVEAQQCRWRDCIIMRSSR